MYLSNSEALMLLAMADGWPSPNLNTLSMTDSSVLVVSRPQKEAQSFTTMPAPITSLPLLIVPACGDRKDTLAQNTQQNKTTGVAEGEKVGGGVGEGKSRELGAFLVLKHLPHIYLQVANINA